MIASVFLLSCGILIAAYFTYGRFLVTRVKGSETHTTPAHNLEDGIDFVPTADPVVFGHHFSSIAGAGPIVGPIVAGLAFGWAPALLWIVIGSIFVGGVHDYTSLMASIRHGGRTIGQICRQYLSPVTYYMFLLFIWFTLVYVLIVFLDLTATTFAPGGAALKRGGSVATASLLYILIALVFGLAVNKLRLKLRMASFIFVPLVFVALWVGYRLPLTADMIPAFLGSSKNTWSALLVVYCFVASITPVWILLQPRDYLSSFLLFACLAGGAIGLILGGIGGTVTLSYPAFIGWSDPHLGFIFPALFITIACGAVSGFHSIVASGTTARQLNTEHSAKPIAYGGMLTEGALAVVALAAVMMLATKPQGQSPVATFAGGVGTFLATMNVDKDFATTFALLAVSTFLLTTLDTCTRLARFIFQELFDIDGSAARILATAASLAIPAVVVFLSIPGPGGTTVPAWKAIWPAFGTTNQLLAALALLVVFAWLRHTGRKAWFVFWPMVFMVITTLTSLTRLAYANLFGGGSIFIGGLSAVLGLLAVGVVIDTTIHLRRYAAPAASPAVDSP
ncbi:MAG: carbon starvation protein A [Verrucomicrobia bacterium]|nr:carbon starvation protein A [Verrucomicrobiota bacterium]